MDKDCPVPRFRPLASLLLLACLFSPSSGHAAGGCAQPSPKAKTGNPVGPGSRGIGYKYVNPRDYFKGEQDFPFFSCQCDGRWEKVEASQAVQRVLKEVSKAVGYLVPVHSCLRKQVDQDTILRRYRCAPRFGTVDCNGRIANKSEHTQGTAADFMVLNVKGDPGKLCRLLDQARLKGNQGMGGVSVYGVDPNGVAALHFDAKEDWCNWSICQKVLGEGHCKRGRFDKLKTALEAKLADAKKASQDAVLRSLQARLAALLARCPRGDNVCRDLYKQEVN